jgi:hypothetical protein
MDGWMLTGREGGSDEIDKEGASGIRRRDLSAERSSRATKRSVRGGSWACLNRRRATHPIAGVLLVVACRRNNQDALSTDGRSPYMRQTATANKRHVSLFCDICCTQDDCARVDLVPLVLSETKAAAAELQKQEHTKEEEGSAELSSVGGRAEQEAGGQT